MWLRVMIELLEFPNSGSDQVNEWAIKQMDELVALYFCDDVPMLNHHALILDS